jgi:biopolymer transport protein ExbB
MNVALIPLLVVPVLFAQAAPAASGSDAVKVQSVWDFVVKGGPVMIPIALCSLLALMLVVERLVSLRRGNIIPPQFMPGLTALLESPDGRARAVDYCGKSNTPIATLLLAAIKRLGEPLEVIERRIQEAGEREIAKLRKHFRLLSVIASVAPLLGLLGTITGMITAFQTVATSAEALGRTELLAKGIYEAMITTAGGLMVAIPTLVAYHWLSAKVDRLVHDMDGIVMEFVEAHVERRPSLAAVSSARMQTLPMPIEGGDGRAAAVALAS